MCRSWEKLAEAARLAQFWGLMKGAQRQPSGTGLVRVGKQVGREDSGTVTDHMSWQDETVAGKSLETKRRRQTRGVG